MNTSSHERTPVPGDAGARRFMLALLPLFIAAAVMYSVCIPDWQNSDEPFHYIYIRTLRREGRLPAHNETYQAAHPPLYYALAALWAAPFRERGAGFLDNWIRLLSVLLGACTIYLLYRIGRDILDDPWIGAAMAAFAAVNPAFVTMHAVVNNDPAAILACTGAIYLMLAATRRGGGWKTAALCGAASGAACLTKISANLLAPFFFFHYLFHLSNRGRGARRIVAELAVFCAVLAAVCAWFYAWNYLRIGDRTLFNPVSEPRRNPLYVPENLAWFVKSHLLNFQLPQDYLRGQPEGLPPIMKALYFGLSAVSLFSIAAALFSAWKSTVPLKRHVMLGFAFCLAVYFAQMYLFNLKVPVAQARYMFIIMGPVAALVVSPFRELLGPRFGKAVVLCFIPLFLLHFVWALVYFLPLGDLGFGIG